MFNQKMLQKIMCDLFKMMLVGLCVVYSGGGGGGGSYLITLGVTIKYSRPTSLISYHHCHNTTCSSDLSFQPK